jgi:hypothetical protein
LGYPLQAAFQSSKPIFSIYRSFDYLHSRVILELQDQLRELEQRLKDLDEDDEYSLNPKQKQRLRSRMDDSKYHPQPSNGHNNTSENRLVISERALLLAEIQEKLLTYDEILMKARDFAEFQRPSDRDWLGLRTWLYNKKPLNAEPEDRFIRMKDDLITLQPRADWGKIDDWIELTIVKLPQLMTTVSMHLLCESLGADERQSVLHQAKESRIRRQTRCLSARYSDRKARRSHRRACHHPSLGCTCVRHVPNNLVWRSLEHFPQYWALGWLLACVFCCDGSSDEGEAGRALRCDGSVLRCFGGVHWELYWQCNSSRSVCNEKLDRKTRSKSFLAMFCASRGRLFLTLHLTRSGLKLN